MWAQGFLGGSDSKESTGSARDPGSIPGSGRSPGGEMASRSSILAWKIPWKGEPGRLQSTGSQRVGHSWVTSLSFLSFFLWAQPQITLEKCNWRHSVLAVYCIFPYTFRTFCTFYWNALVCRYKTDTEFGPMTEKQELIFSHVYWALVLIYSAWLFL